MKEEHKKQINQLVRLCEQGWVYVAVKVGSELDLDDMQIADVVSDDANYELDTISLPKLTAHFQKVEYVPYEDCNGLMEWMETNLLPYIKGKIQHDEDDITIERT